MNFIYSISDPVYEMKIHKADLCIERNVINIYSKINPKFLANNIMCRYTYCPHIITNITWKPFSKYVNTQKYFVIYTLYSYPKDLVYDIINADIVYVNKDYINFLHSIGDECVSFEQLIDELYWYKKVFVNNNNY